MNAKLLLRPAGRLLETHGRSRLATVVAATARRRARRPRACSCCPDGSTRGTIGGGKFESLVVADAGKLLDGGGLPFTRRYDFVPRGPRDGFGAVCGGTATVLLEVLERAPRLLVVGAGHCGRALARMASFAGWDVAVADERPEQLDPAAFPADTSLVPVKDDYSDLPFPRPA